MAALPQAQVVVRAPNHLGDGVMSLPAVEALADRGPVVVHAPSWGQDLYGPLGVAVRPVRQPLEGDVAVLFPPSLRAAWEARRVPRRVGVVADGRGPWITDPVVAGPHTADTYRRLAEAVGGSVAGPPVWRGATLGSAVAPHGHLALNPLSATPATREWSGWTGLAARWPGPVVFYGGPGEAARLADVARGFPQVVGLPLPALAGSLGRAVAMVSVDTGPAHFARAVGLPTLVVHGSTSPAGSGPAGSTAVEGEAPCRPCYRAACRPRGCAVRACLDIPVEQVWSGLHALLGASR